MISNKAEKINTLQKRINYLRELSGQDSIHETTVLVEIIADLNRVPYPSNLLGSTPRVVQLSGAVEINCVIGHATIFVQEATEELAIVEWNKLVSRIGN